jgi:hypothetical protein
LAFIAPRFTISWPSTDCLIVNRPAILATILAIGII